MKQKRIFSLILSLVLMTSLFTPFSAFATGNATKITVSSVSDTAGSTVNVVVAIENNPGILGATLTFDFDNELKLVGASNGEAFAALQMTPPGILKSPCNFTWDGQEIADKDIRDGNILTLRFKIPDDAVAGTKYKIAASYMVGDIMDNYLKPVTVEIEDGIIEVNDFTYGDVNSDRAINSGDTILIRRHIAGGYEQDIKEEAADVNVDNSINSGDTILVRRFIAGGYGITFPYSTDVCNHMMQFYPAKAATEEEEGNKEYWYCKACNKYFKDERGTNEISKADTITPVLPKSEYTIQYMCDMVPIGPDNKPITYEPDTYKPTQTIILPVPKMDTYKFLGWSDKSGRMFGTEIPEGTTGDLVLYANWASNRNKAVPVKKLEAPIICEDSENGQILFVYEIGRIENIPMFETQDLLVANGLITSTGIVKQNSITKGNAEEIGKTIANTTTNSSTWSLSKDWNETTSVSEEWAEQQGMTVEEAEAFSKSDSNTFNIVNSSGGSSSLVNNDSSSYKMSANKGHEDSNTTENQKYTNYNIDGKYSNSTTVDARMSAELNAGLSAGLKVPLKGKAEGSLGANVGGSLGAEAGISNTSAWEIGLGAETGGYVKGSSTGTDNWGVSVDASNAKSSTYTSEKTWNSEQGFSSSSSTSSTSSVSKSVSELISQKHSKDTSYSTGGSEGESKEYASSNANEDKYSSSVTYSEAEISISERKFESTGNTYGAYRLVQVGMARVFGVVGYDIKNKTYYTTTYSVLDDDEYKEYLDYSYDRTFNDYETSVLPFEIPIFVNNYVNSRIASSKLQINDSGIVTKYLGEADDEVVLIPSYYTRTNNTTGKAEMFKITGIAPGLFKDNTNIIGVSLGNFVSEIPDSAFEGCTALKEVVCPNVISIGANAFKGCISLSEFTLPNEIEYIGEEAFDGIPAIKSNAPTKEIASIVANSNIQNITLDISSIEADDFSDMSFAVGEIQTFKLLGGTDDGAKEYRGLNISSDALTTIISGITISESDVVPIEVSSPNLTLERVTAQSEGFALILKADETVLSLEGVSSLLSESSHGIIAKNITLSQINDETYSEIQTNSSVLVCGTVNENEGYIAEDKIVTITEEEYINYLTSRKVTFDANGGVLGAETSYKMVPYNGVMGELPFVSRDYYQFKGWFTEAEGGEEVTAETVMTSLVDITLYAHWEDNITSEWVLKSEMPEDAQIVDTKYTYTLTEYITSGSSSMSGWTKAKDETWEWGPYGGWSGWSTNQYYGSDSRQVESVGREQWIDTSYNLHEYHYYCWTPKKGWYYTTKSAAAAAGVGTPVLKEIWISYQLAPNKYSGGMQHYGPYDDGYLYFKADGTAGGLTPFERDRWIPDGYWKRWTEWRYRDRSKIWTYYYKRDSNKESAEYPVTPNGCDISNIEEWVQYKAK